MSSLKNKNPCLDKTRDNVASVSGNIETPSLSFFSSLFFFFCYTSRGPITPWPWFSGFKVTASSHHLSQLPPPPTQIKPQRRVRRTARPSHVAPVNTSHWPACHHGNCQVPSRPRPVTVRQRKVTCHILVLSLTVRTSRRGSRQDGPHTHTHTGVPRLQIIGLCFLPPP